MSSVFGHSVAGVTIYLATEAIFKPRSFIAYLKVLVLKSKDFLWLLWLIVIASMPDLDYAIEALQSSNNQGLRITHSILFSLIAPGLTIVVLFWLKIRGQQLLLRSLQLILAGLSHLALDLAVGVTPLPLFFPVVNIPLKLPFGILPSAGKIDLNNYYFYRNLKLEMSVLLPVLSLVCIWSDRSNSQLSLINNGIKIFFSTLLLLCCSYFIRLNLALPR